MELSDIKGLGAKRIESLRKAGIERPEDLLLHFPQDYIDTQKSDFWPDCQDGETVVVLGQAEGKPVQRFVRKGLRLTRIVFQSEQGAVDCTWFNHPYIARNVVPGQKYYLMGKLKKSRSGAALAAPILYPYEKGASIIPIYKSINGLPGRVIEQAIRAILVSVRVDSYIPEDIKQSNGLLDLHTSLCCLHSPVDLRALTTAYRSITIENLSVQLAMFVHLKQKQEGVRVFFYKERQKKLIEAAQTLPFCLTDGQTDCLAEIIAALHGDKRMNRLLQGDVGSGKTIVAMLTMYYAFLSGYQSALMVPTEILARQHYQKAIQMFEPLGVRAGILTSSQSAREKADMLFRIANGQVHFVIGTHSMLQDDVVFSNLSLVITDEQQRFGVGQRGSLENKTAGADTLTMSATPIPRTLSLVMYGELEQSVLKERPLQRTKIRTKFVSISRIGDLMQYILERAQKGEQAFLVCSRIEEDGDNPDLLSVKQLFKRIKSSVLSEYSGLIHGKMKDSEKNAVMQDFYLGKIKVLAATSVIEVGIDVPAATTMVIFNAERYGLSQLHQLRGRVGRGTLDSYCFLQTENRDSLENRLQYFSECENGFELAEYDFLLRGAGDFLGTRQHGSSDERFRLDEEVIGLSKQISADLLSRGMISDETLDRDSGSSRYIKRLTLN